jgi:hypothetical protein
MGYYPTPQEIAELQDEVSQRISTYDDYSNQWQQGIQTKHRRRIDEIIIDVVKNYYGRLVQEAVKQLRRLFSLS